jgi:hypothetical protein
MTLRDRFWLYDPKVLFSSSEFIPMDGMSFANKLNAITRTVIIFIVIGIILKLPNTIGFGFIALLIIILIYYINKEMNTSSENYTKLKGQQHINKNNEMYQKLVYNSTSNVDKQQTWKDNVKCLYSADQQNVWCDDGAVRQAAPSACDEQIWSSPNAAYSKPSNNPKVNQKPIIPTPILAMESWRTNEFVTRSNINTHKPTDIVQSGYLIDGKYQPGMDRNWCGEEKKYRERGNCFDPYDCTTNVPILYDENFQPGKDVYATCCGGSGCGSSGCKDCARGINEVSIETKYGVPIEVCATLPGDMDEMCGYDPAKSIYAGLPNNQPAGDFQQYPTLRCYNENAGLQTLQPGIYTQTEVNEPQMSNLGISYAQQFEPVEIKTDKYGNKIYVQRDPRINCNSKIKAEPYVQTVNESTIYDPRGYGYGDNKRMYIDDMTGQPRWYYDDINAAKQGNYIIRSDIDTLPFADKYGMLDTENGNENCLSSIKCKVDGSWMNSTSDFRVDLQERLMKKANEKTRQQRLAPLRRDGGMCMTSCK